MSAQTLIAVILLLGGALLDVPVAVVLGTVALILEAVRLVWRRWGLAGVRYRRVLPRPAANWGEEIPLTVEIWNRKRLPLAWLRADDTASDGITVRETDLVPDEDPVTVNLRNTWTLAPFERVGRRFHIAGDRRGVFELGPVDLAVGDLFGREAATHEEASIDRFLVRPRIVAAQSPTFERVDGLHRTAAGLTEDPSRFAGVREYTPGDPLRRIHQRTSARVGQPMVKRFEPSTEREVLLAVDIQTEANRGWSTSFVDDEIEALYVAAASLTHALAADRIATGFAACGYSGSPRPIAYLPVSARPGQAQRIVDLIARLSSTPSAPFERLLPFLASVSRPGTTVVVLTTRDPSPYIRHLRALRRRGCSVVVLGHGQGAEDIARIARAAGFSARGLRLDAPWRTAEHLTVVA
jgi:uncharacterized protein (DUF58 family)